jgi:ABC-type transport system substrate-binding protein
VRKALTLALDRYEGSKLFPKIAVVKDVEAIQVPGTPFTTPPGQLEKLAGYGKYIAANRAEAKRLLKEAGAENLSFTYKNRGVAMPYEPMAVWLIDQWRQIGVTVKQEVVEAAAYYATLRGGDFEVAADFQCGFIVEPDLDIYKFSRRRSPMPTTAATRTGRWTISYVKQARAWTRRSARGPARLREVASTRRSLHSRGNASFPTARR